MKDNRNISPMNLFKKEFSTQKFLNLKYDPIPLCFSTFSDLLLLEKSRRYNKESRGELKCHEGPRWSHKKVKREEEEGSLGHLKFDFI